MSEKKTVYDKLVDWFDLKFGFAKTPLKPIPDYNQNPIYWLGLLLAITFGLQALTGILMLLYYVPTPAEAYSSTMFIINSVPLGKLIETFHLYTAYAMIILTFLHLVRNYFGSSFKGNRDLMWLVGIGLGGIVVGFGVTGYLLPWTVISKSASDVGLGLINFFPTPLANLGKFVALGSGSDASQLNSFLHIHTVFLPLALIAFLGLKIYMYEVHGPSYIAAYGKLKPSGGKYVRWFPKIFLYAVVITSVYVAILAAASSLFPLSLPPAYTPIAAGQTVVQPDWYLLWLYQLLKIQVFEGTAAVYAIVGVLVFLVLLFLLPFYDRSKRKGLSQRPIYVTIGAVLIFEFLTLTVWGYLTPGQVIPDYQAVAVLGGVAVATILPIWAVYRLRKSPKPLASAPSTIPPTSTPIAASPPVPQKATATNKVQIMDSLKKGEKTLFTRFTAVFVAFLTIASISLASLVGMAPSLLSNRPLFALALAGFVSSLLLMCRMLRGMVHAYENGVVAK